MLRIVGRIPLAGYCDQLGIPKSTVIRDGFLVACQVAITPPVLPSEEVELQPPVFGCHIPWSSRFKPDRELEDCDTHHYVTQVPIGEKLEEVDWENL